jgi:hypothetical protein
MDGLFEMFDSEWRRFGWHKLWLSVLDHGYETFKIPNWNLERCFETGPWAF